jgi:hypothetical protein
MAPPGSFGDFETGILHLGRLKTGHRAQFDVMEYPLFHSRSLPCRRISAAGLTSPTRLAIPSATTCSTTCIGASLIPLECQRRSGTPGRGMAAVRRREPLAHRPRTLANICRSQTSRERDGTTSPGMSRLCGGSRGLGWRCEEAAWVRIITGANLVPKVPCPQLQVEIDCDPRS